MVESTPLSDQLAVEISRMLDLHDQYCGVRGGDAQRLASQVGNVLAAINRMDASIYAAHNAIHSQDTREQERALEDLRGYS